MLVMLVLTGMSRNIVIYVRDLCKQYSSLFFIPQCGNVIAMDALRFFCFSFFFFLFFSSSFSPDLSSIACGIGLFISTVFALGICVGYCRRGFPC